MLRHLLGSADSPGDTWEPTRHTKANQIIIFLEEHLKLGQELGQKLNYFT